MRAGKRSKREIDELPAIVPCVKTASGTDAHRSYAVTSLRVRLIFISTVLPTARAAFINVSS